MPYFIILRARSVSICAIGRKARHNSFDAYQLYMIGNLRKAIQENIKLISKNHFYDLLDQKKNSRLPRVWTVYRKVRLNLKIIIGKLCFYYYYVSILLWYSCVCHVSITYIHWYEILKPSIGSPFPENKRIEIWAILKLSFLIGSFCYVL